MKAALNPRTLTGAEQLACGWVAQQCQDNAQLGQYVRDAKPEVRRLVYDCMAAYIRKHKDFEPAPYWALVK